jgi:hypothetical protein
LAELSPVIAACGWFPVLSGAGMARLLIVVIACNVSVPLELETYQAYATAPWNGAIVQKSVCPRVTA